MRWVLEIVLEVLKMLKSERGIKSVDKTQYGFSYWLSIN